MARIIQTEQQQVVVEPWWVKVKIVYIGLGLGLAWWVCMSILRHYVVEPLACSNLSMASACVDSLGVAGSISAILIGVLGAYLLVRWLQPRPIVIALSTAVLLWDLGYFLTGLAWWETILWSLFFYGLTYGLFSLVARVRGVVWSLVLAAIVVILIRLFLSF